MRLCHPERNRRTPTIFTMLPEQRNTFHREIVPLIGVLRLAASLRGAATPLRMTCTRPSPVRALLPQPVICDTGFESPRAPPMGRIHVLSENVANKIAAGEVVERPASVAKELLENSLDAGATRIRIQIEAGGKKLIQITDNGCGMVRDDALLAFERHATSKIKNAEDLLSVATLGFRGEALPSIASVSRLRLETAHARRGLGNDHRDQRRQDFQSGRSGPAARDLNSRARPLL